MKPLKKLSVLLLVAVMLLSGCTKPDAGNVTATDTPAVSATLEPDVTGTPIPTQLATGAPTGEANVTAAPTAAPTAAQTPAPTNKPINNEPVEIVTNVIPDNAGKFDNVSNVSQTGWSALGSSVQLGISNNGYNGKCLYFKKDPSKSASYHTAILDISKYITEASTYTISFKYMIKGEEDVSNPFQVLVRTGGETSFAARTADGNIYAPLDYAIDGYLDEWLDYEGVLSVKSEDIGKGKPWNFGMHLINEGISEIYIDELRIERSVYADTAKPVTGGVTWVANEAVFVSSKDYEAPFYDVDVDLILTNGSVSYTIPCFWDGGATWRARFVCPTAGNWSYKTVCTDKTNTGLHNQQSSFKITQYSGQLDVYKHGFVKTVPGTRYFVYDDGTPFFYLGDTHWNLSSEPLSNIKTIVDKRVQQKYTVIQSEPLGAAFNFIDGIENNDIKGLRTNDEKFKYIADNGLVHANASFFFPSQIQQFVENNGGFSKTSVGTATHTSGNIAQYDLSTEAKAQLERICRYWVARYSAYPVMWTLGQEVDNDFYFERDGFGGHEKWSFINNPYKYMAEYLYKHDPYKHPLSAHQEYTGATMASNSAFRDVTGHTWYAAQWSPSLTGGSLQSVAMDYWNNGQGKPTVNYEGRYCYLWTKNFGARAQGWMSYLSGMFGYGWGGQDTWSYLNTYNEDANSSDGVDTITSEEKKAATWRDSLEYPSAYQVGYMHSFFANTVGDWYNLIPRFDNTSYLQRQSGAFTVVASNSSNSKIVAYFYNFSDSSVGANVNSASGGTRTGTFKSLTPNATYNYLWFNPITGQVTKTGTFTANASGQWSAGEKASCDMVLYIYK